MFNNFVTACRTLSIIPLPGKDTKNFSMSLPYFPAIGALAGLLSFILYLFCRLIIPSESWLQAIFLVLGTTIFTGGLHLDGLADVADAFGGGHTKEDIFRILKDSRLGTFGVLALIFDLALKISLYEYLLRRNLIFLLVSQFIFSKAMLAITLLITPYASGKTGTASPFANPRPLSWLGTLLSLIIFFNLAAFMCGHLLLVILALAASLPCWFFLSLCRKKIAGITGDCLGAINEIYEVTFLIITMFCVILNKLPLPVYP